MPPALSAWLEGPRKFITFGALALILGLALYVFVFSAGEAETGDPSIRPVRKAWRDKDVAALKTFANDANPKVASEALYCLQQVNKGEAAGVLRDKANNAPNPVKAAALVNLGLVGDASDVPLLAKATADADANVRRAACAGLGHVRSADAIEPLAKVLEKETDDRVAQAALAALRQVSGINVPLRSNGPDQRRAVANQYRAQIPAIRQALSRQG